MIFGFFIASISNTIEKAVAITNVLFIGFMLLSGAYFSNVDLPHFVKVLADLMPVTICDRGRELSPPPSKPYWRILRIRLAR